MNVSKWWIWSAGVTGLLMIALGMGNLIEDDGGPLWGQIIFAAVLFAGAVLIASGIWARRSRPELGSRLVAIGVLPGVSGVALFWFPPAVAVGMLALVSSVAAFADSRGATTGSTKKAVAVGGPVALVAVLLTWGLPG
ncbi:MAG TPA: hypothetical protein VLC48_02445 [Gemmatimonadota bacterium]|jgi:hypothetical protein|nr:hypothetical protein [Gemmatimonadota bacterium]